MMISQMNLRLKKREHKFSNLYDGPFEVLGTTGENSIRIKKGKKIFRVHKDNVKLSPKRNEPHSDSDE